MRRDGLALPQGSFLVLAVCLKCRIVRVRDELEFGVVAATPQRRHACPRLLWPSCIDGSSSFFDPQSLHGQYGVVPELNRQTLLQPSIISGMEALPNDVLLRVQILWSRRGEGLHLVV